MKKVFMSLIFAALAAVSFMLSACDDGVKRVGYGFGLVYNGSSLCRVKIETTGNSIDGVEIDEAGLITDWTRKSEMSGGDVADEDWQEVSVGDTVVTYAKRAQFGDKIFSLDAGGKYALADGTQYDDWIKEAENAEYYWQRMENGDFHILKSDGDKYSVTYSPYAEGQTTDKSKRFFKSKNGYWPAGGHGKGYKANMAAIADFIKAKGVGFNGSDASKNDGGNYVLGGVDTGASVTSFKEYYAVAQKAFDNRGELPG